MHSSIRSSSSISIHLSIKDHRSLHSSVHHHHGFIFNIILLSDWFSLFTFWTDEWMKERKCDKQREDWRMIEWRMNEWIERWMDVKRGLKENESKGEMEESDCNIISDWVIMFVCLHIKVQFGGEYPGRHWQLSGDTHSWLTVHELHIAEDVKVINTTHFIRTVRTLLFQSVQSSNQWRRKRNYVVGMWWVN